ncbi:hypothetical protein F5879DRAFT_811735, partial [Lentinula edodes]
IIILDDITTLHWTGLASPLELGRFCRALRGLCVKNEAVLVIRHHVLSDKEASGDALFRSLHALCTYHMDIQPLTSGRSGVVSGQIALHQGPNSIHQGPATTSKKTALQYKLTDTSAVYFERGAMGL